MLVGEDPFNDGTLLETAGQKVWVTPRGLENGEAIWPGWQSWGAHLQVDLRRWQSLVGRILRLLCFLQ